MFLIRVFCRKLFTTNLQVRHRFVFGSPSEIPIRVSEEQGRLDNALVEDQPVLFGLGYRLLVARPTDVKVIPSKRGLLATVLNYAQTYKNGKT